MQLKNKGPPPVNPVTSYAEEVERRVRSIFRTPRPTSVAAAEALRGTFAVDGRGNIVYLLEACVGASMARPMLPIGDVAPGCGARQDAGDNEAGTDDSSSPSL